MFALVKNDDSIKLFAPYTIWEDKNGTQYSPDSLFSLTASQKQDLGIYDVAYGTRLDDRFYSVSENAPTFDSNEKIVKVTYTSTPRELEDIGETKGLKSQWIAQIKQTANNLLSQTDWALVRKIERNVAVPSATVTYRAAVVAEQERVVTAIAGTTTVEGLIEVMSSIAWPKAE